MSKNEPAKKMILTISEAGQSVQCWLQKEFFFVSRNKLKKKKKKTCHFDDKCKEVINKGVQGFVSEGSPRTEQMEKKKERKKKSVLVTNKWRKKKGFVLTDEQLISSDS
jgi:hypothetical protein